MACELSCLASQESREAQGQRIQDRGDVRVKVLGIRRLACLRKKMKVSVAKASLNTRRSRKHNRERDAPGGSVSCGRNLRHSVLGTWSAEKKMNMKDSQE